MRALLKQAKLPFGLRAWTPVGKSFNTLTMRKTTKWAALIDMSPLLDMQWQSY